MTHSLTPCTHYNTTTSRYKLFHTYLVITFRVAYEFAKQDVKDASGDTRNGLYGIVSSITSWIHNRYYETPELIWIHRSYPNKLCLPSPYVLPPELAQLLSKYSLVIT